MISDRVSKLPLGKGQGLIDETMNHCANFAGDRFDVVNLSNILDRLNFIYVWMDRVEWEGIAAAATAEKQKGGGRESVGGQTETMVGAIGRARVQGVRD